jgi:hypothetical protein
MLAGQGIWQLWQFTFKNTAASNSRVQDGAVVPGFTTAVAAIFGL